MTFLFKVKRLLTKVLTAGNVNTVFGSFEWHTDNSRYKSNNELKA